MIPREQWTPGAVLWDWIAHCDLEHPEAGPARAPAACWKCREYRAEWQRRINEEGGL